MAPPSDASETPTRLAVIADVHGNRWALEAVLEDVERRGVRDLADLGDTVYGPLAPAETAVLLMERASPTVRGNQDRLIWQPLPEVADSPTYRYVREALSEEQVSWLQGLPLTRRLGGVLLCHGTPAQDDAPLLEEIGPRTVSLASPETVRTRLGTRQAPVVLCGHTHVPRTLALPEGPLVVNPGSVGLPAYTDDTPFPHALETGSPHARYAVLERRDEGWAVLHLAVPYDWQTAARTARRNGRRDWERWLRLGRG